ncbi:MAG: hypothetical protein ABI395_07680 [Sphingobium sp.]|jgi:hypothetical protein
MKRTLATIVMLGILSLTACSKSGDRKLADRVENHADAQADMLENRADALNAEAKQIRHTGEQRSDAIDAANLNTAAMSNTQKAAIVNDAAPAVR